MLFLCLYDHAAVLLFCKKPEKERAQSSLPECTGSCGSYVERKFCVQLSLPAERSFKKSPVFWYLEVHGLSCLSSITEAAAADIPGSWYSQ